MKTRYKKHSKLLNHTRAPSQQPGNNAMAIADNRSDVVQRLLIDVGGDEDRKELDRSKKQYVERPVSEGASEAKMASRNEGTFEDIGKLVEGEKVHIWSHYYPEEDRVGRYSAQGLVDEMTKTQAQIDGLKKAGIVVLNACSTAEKLPKMSASYASKVAIFLSKKLSQKIIVKAALGPTHVKDHYDVVAPKDPKFEEHRTLQEEIKQWNQAHLGKEVKPEDKKAIEEKTERFNALNTELDKEWPLEKLKGQQKVQITYAPNSFFPVEKQHEPKRNKKG